jgi:hypothetical protein
LVEDGAAMIPAFARTASTIVPVASADHGTTRSIAHRNTARRGVRA